MSSQTAEPAVSEKRTEILDLRTALLFIFFRHGSYGIMREEIPNRFVYWGHQEKNEIVVSLEELDAAIEALKKEGLVVEAKKQSATGGTTDMFLSLAKGIKLVAGSVT